MIYIILVACVLSFLVGFFVLIGNPVNTKNLSFAFFCFVASIWILFNFLIYYTYNLYFPHPAYAFGTLMIGTILSWTYIYFGKHNAWWKHVIIYVYAGSVAYMSLFTHLIIAEVKEITVTGIVIVEGVFFPLFLIYLIFGGLFATIRMFFFYKRARGSARRKNFLIFLGMGLFLSISLIVSGVLPTFGIFTLTNLDSVSSIFFIVFTCIAIYKHNFLSAKLVLAQLLILIIISINVIQLLHSASPLDYFLKFTLLFFIVVLGAALILAIKKEVKRKEEMEAANSQLRKLDQTKSEFISMASHQLRTPLTTMKGFIGVMKNGSYGKLPENFEEPLDIMETANERLILLVEEMLSVSQIESGKMAFDFKEENVNELIDELGDSFRIAAKNRGLILQIKKSVHLPSVRMDYNKMRETLSNIIDNAIKYTNEGNILIQTAREENCVIISIKDSGIGITQDEQKHLFEKFTRGERARELKKSGVGLGLYLGKKIIEAHRGHIYAHANAKGPGATFVVQIPLYKHKK